MINSSFEKIKALLRFRHKFKLFFWQYLVLDVGEIPAKSRLQRVQGEESHRMANSVLLPESNIETLLPTHIHYPPIWVHRFQGAALCGERAVPISADRKVVTEHLGGLVPWALSSFEAIKPTASFIQSFRRCSTQVMVCFSINGPYTFNYYHWVTDCLPLLKSYEAIDGDAVLILPAGLTTWQVRHLELLGYDEGDYKSHTGENTRCKTLLLPTWHKPVFQNHKGEHDYYSMPPAKSTIDWMRERVLSNLKQEQKDSIAAKSTPQKIFVSRMDANKVRIWNEGDVQKLAQEYGVVVVELSKLSVDEQVALFSSAEVVIGIHGAGLSNLVYSIAPTVLEIFQPNEVLNFFITLTSMIGGRHYSYIADSLNESGQVVVDLESFRAALESLLALEADHS